MGRTKLNEFMNKGYDNNYVIDGNFQVAQANPTVATGITNPASGAYPVFDLWKVIQGNTGSYPTLVHSQQLITAGSVPNSKYLYRINASAAGTVGADAYYTAQHFIEHGTQNLCGLNKKVTVSFWARTSISGTKRFGIQLFQSYGTGGSPSSGESISGGNFTLTSTWTKYTTTITTNTLSGKTFGTNNDDYLCLRVWYAWGSNQAVSVEASTAETFVGAGDIEIAQVKLEPGDTATTFLPRLFIEELRRCQRYYEKSYDYLNAGGTGTYSNILDFKYAITTGCIYTVSVQYKVSKRITVTPTYYDGAGVINKIYFNGNGGTPATPYYSQHGFSSQTPAAGSTSQQEFAFHYIVDARF